VPARAKSRSKPAPSRRRRPIVLLLGNLGVLVALVALAEGAARLFAARDFDPLFSMDRLGVAARPFTVPHPRRGFALKPGFQDRLYRINGDGFRGPDLPADLPVRKVVAVLGESTMFGWDVAEGEDFPARLGRLLSEKRAAYYVVNAAVPSYTSSQVRLYLEEVIDRLKPELALVSVLWNDIMYSTLAAWTPDVLVFRQPALWEQFLLRHSGVYRALVLASASPSRVDVFNERAYAAYAANMEAIIDVCARHGVRLGFVEPPFDLTDMSEAGFDPFGQIRLTKPFFVEVARRYRDRLAELASRHGAAVLDHRLSLRRPAPGELFIDLLHQTPAGHAAIASDVGRQLVERGLID